MFLRLVGIAFQQQPALVYADCYGNVSSRQKGICPGLAFQGDA